MPRFLILLLLFCGCSPNQPTPQPQATPTQSTVTFPISFRHLGEEYRHAGNDDRDPEVPGFVSRLYVRPDARHPWKIWHGISTDGRFKYFEMVSKMSNPPWARDRMYLLYRPDGMVEQWKGYDNKAAEGFPQVVSIDQIHHDLQLTDFVYD